MKKKSLITLFSLFAVVIVGLLVGVIVLASQTQNLNSNISISYTATEISGGVSATYKIGDGEEKDMIVDGNESKLVATFDADLNSTTQGLSPTESQLVLLAKQDLIFTYTFFNRGDYPYYATLNYTDSNNDDMNIDVYYKSASDAEFSMDNATQIQVPAMVGEAVGTTTYQVKMTIHDSSFDSKMSGVFNWNLSKEKPLNISLAYTNNTDSAINPENVTIVTNEDKTQFKIVGPTPIVADSSTTNLTELTNASGSEFYYFASNSEVKDTTGYTDPGTTYYVSPYSTEESASTMYTYGQGLQNMSASMASDPSQYTANEVWYDMPAKPTIIYATFMTPNNTTGDKSGGAEGDIIISHTVYSLSRYAFMQSQITSCVIPNTVTRIGELAFYYCLYMTSLELPESLISMEHFSVSFCMLNELVIPKSASSIKAAFSMCPALTKIIVIDGNTKYHSVDNCLIEIESNTLILGCNNSIIPTDGSVKSIGEGAFHNCTSLTEIIIPDSVISIGDSAFTACAGLTKLIIGNSVTSIGNDAFSECISLTNITIPGSVTSMGERVFYKCEGLTSVTIGSGVTSIGDFAFEYCSSLTEIIIPDSVTSIGGSAFNYCSSLSYNILDNVEYLGNNENPYVVVMGVTDKTLTSYTISNNTKIIRGYIFSDCSNLTDITIPESVISIEFYAFVNCSNLTNVTFENTSGWQVSTSSDMSSPTSLDSSNLANASTAATYLKSTYYKYYWKRS